MYFFIKFYLYLEYIRSYVYTQQLFKNFFKLFFLKDWKLVVARRTAFKFFINKRNGSKMDSKECKD